MLKNNTSLTEFLFDKLRFMPKIDLKRGLKITKKDDIIHFEFEEKSGVIQIFNDTQYGIKIICGNKEETIIETKNYDLLKYVVVNYYMLIFVVMHLILNYDVVIHMHNEFDISFINTKCFCRKGYFGHRDLDTGNNSVYGYDAISFVKYIEDKANLLKFNENKKKQL